MAAAQLAHEIRVQSPIRGKVNALPRGKRQRVEIGDFFAAFRYACARPSVGKQTSDKPRQARLGFVAKKDIDLGVSAEHVVRRRIDHVLATLVEIGEHDGSIRTLRAQRRQQGAERVVPMGRAMKGRDGDDHDLRQARRIQSRDERVGRSPKKQPVGANAPDRRTLERQSVEEFDIVATLAKHCRGLHRTEIRKKRIVDEVAGDFDGRENHGNTGHWTQCSRAGRVQAPGNWTAEPGKFQQYGKTLTLPTHRAQIRLVMRRFVSPALSALAAASISAFVAPTAMAQESDWDGNYDVESTRRSDFTFGAALGMSIGDATGSPNDISKIDDPTYEASTGATMGGGMSLWVGGALRDWMVFAIGMQGSSLKSPGTEAKGGALFFRVESYPLFWKGGVWENVALTADFGAGGQQLLRGTEVVADGGSMSFIAVGVSYEAFRWGDHVSAGPTLQYQTLFSQSMTTQTGFLGFRMAFYGGP